MLDFKWEEDKKDTMQQNNLKGLTLIEVMVVIVVVMVGVLALWQVYGNSLNLIIQAKEIRIATSDLEDVLEYINTLAFSHITDSSRGGFNHDDNVNSDLIGGFLLENESIVVRYPQGEGADPLEIEVEINWIGRNQRSYSQTFRTVRSSGL